MKRKSAPWKEIIAAPVKILGEVMMYFVGVKPTRKLHSL